MESDRENSDASGADEFRATQSKREPRKVDPAADSGSSDEEEDDEEEEEEEEEESSYDEEECAKRRTECARAMIDLERQFVKLREQLYQERITQVQQRLDGVRRETADEYKKPLADLEEMCRIRDSVADVYKQCRLRNIENKYYSDAKCAEETFFNERTMMIDGIRSELEEKISRLDEERQLKDIELWPGSRKRRHHEHHQSERKRKTVTVSGPFIVYMLRDDDIQEDWSALRRARLRQNSTMPARKRLARFEDGKLFYDGTWFENGCNVTLVSRRTGNGKYNATVVGLNTAEVVLQKEDGSKARVYITQLQSGDQTLKLIKLGQTA